MALYLPGRTESSDGPGQAATRSARRSRVRSLDSVQEGDLGGRFGAAQRQMPGGAGRR